MPRSRSAFLALAAALALTAPAPADQALKSTDAALALTDALAVGEVGQWGRRAINTDAVVALMVSGGLGEPKAGDTLKRAGASGDKAERTWAEARANDQGEFADLPRGAYVLCTVESDADRVMILEASGHAMVYVNAEPRAGDPYAHGYVKLPVALRKGRNQLLFAHAGRGPLKGKLVAPTAELMINTDDVTAPDVVEGDDGLIAIGVPVLNASTRPRRVRMSAAVAGSNAAHLGDPLTIPPCAVIKVPVPGIVPPDAARGTTTPLAVQILDVEDRTRPIDTQTISIKTVGPADKRKITFQSAIDASIQYYAVVPPLPPSTEPPAAAPPSDPRPALVLSLHGASVEATNQARSYAPKPGVLIVCPTNRRPFGFDWEDWGRLDALEVMDHAAALFRTDPDRQYLTGHSMGGHGTWQLGVLHPDRFAAIAPSAGWLSFDTYVNSRPDAPKKQTDPLLDVFKRAAASSDTIAMLPNLKGKGIYILHGDADDNVPVSEARRARAELDKLGIPYASHEEPGAGHWWDKDKADKPEPYTGAACVDWPAVFETFAKHSLKDQLAATEYKTIALAPCVYGPVGAPGVAAPFKHGLPATVTAVREPDGRLTVTATNAVAIDLPGWLFGDQAKRTVRFGAQVLTQTEHPDSHRFFTGADGRWREWTPWAERRACPAVRKPDFPSPFKSAFTKRFVLVYSTAGSAEENAWSFAKARFDAEQWWYRGNGSTRLLSDKDFIASLPRPADGNMPALSPNAVLYGNSRTNLAARELLSSPNVGVIAGRVTVGDRSLEGDDYAVLLVHPAMTGRFCGTVALVGGTGLTGMRATDRLPYFLAGVGFPDVTVLKADVWSKGAQGVKLAGFFGPGWQAAPTADFTWRDPEPTPEATTPAPADPAPAR